MHPGVWRNGIVPVVCRLGVYKRDLGVSDEGRKAEGPADKGFGEQNWHDRVMAARLLARELCSSARLLPGLLTATQQQALPNTTLLSGNRLLASENQVPGRMTSNTERIPENDRQRIPPPVSPIVNGQLTHGVSVTGRKTPQTHSNHTTITRQCPGKEHRCVEPLCVASGLSRGTSMQGTRFFSPLVRPKLYLPYSELQAIAAL